METAAPAQTLPTVPATTSTTAPAAVTTTLPAQPAPVVVAGPGFGYQVWQGLQGAVRCDVDQVCGPNRAYVRSPVNVGTPTVITTSPTAAMVSGGPVSQSLPAPPFMQSIGSQAQPVMTVPQPQPMAAAPAVTTSSGVFVPSPVAGSGSPVITSVQPGSGFVPSPAGANQSFVVTSMTGGSPVAVAPGTAAVPMQVAPAAAPQPTGGKPAAKAPAKRSKKKKAKCCGCF
eukprot:Skav231109  [mRNA]  locus=scaffold2525:530892:538227:- [translate_table: standard]